MTYAKQPISGISDGLVPLSLTITPQLARWISFASTHNGIPILRQLAVELTGSVSAHGLEISLHANPPFVHPSTIRLDRLDPTGSRVLEAPTLHPNQSFLAGLTEAIEGHLIVELSALGVCPVSQSFPIRLLPADQWEGLSDLPELLAAHVQPNHPVIGGILSTAGALLKSQNLSLSGYQKGSREVVARQIAAIYSALRQRDFAYINPPANFHAKGQRIRLPDQVAQERLATCLDLAVLFAACIEQAGLHALILIKKRHAWAGCWLDEGSSGAGPADEDGQSFRKRLAIGELLCIETTHLTDKTALLADAQRVGKENLENEKEFEAAVDIRLARQSGIRPIPSRVNGQFEVSANVDPEVDKIDAVEVIDESAPREADVEAEPLNRRLESWKRKLLDLTLRNRLLNFKETAKTLRLVGTDLSSLEDELADHKEFTFEVNPRFDQQVDPTTGRPLAAEIASERLDSLATGARSRSKLVTMLDSSEKLITRLTDFYRNARTAEDESGVSPLYLALGILEWRETERSTAVNRAPILLVPVALDRSSVKAGLSGFKLISRDEDIRINPTLLEKLRRDFGIAFDIPDTPPTDESGADVKQVMTDFRHLVVNRKGWEVKEEICLGEFSFKKFLMWSDLQERESVLRKHPLVFQMLEHPNTPIPSQGLFPESRELDAKFPPSEVFTPLMCDSSQLSAVQAASEGKSFVLEGPPGTGKSQTITNLISHCIAHGKTVLFVSEKRAALDVVRKRLDDVGLGAYCLEVHSDKAKKTEILEQLRAPLEPAKFPPQNRWSEITKALSDSRRKLNEYVDALHSRYPCGLTIYEAAGWLSARPAQPSLRLGWGDPNEWKLPPLSEMRSLVVEIEPVLDQLGVIRTCALVGSQLEDASPVIERTAKDAVAHTRQAIGMLEKYAGRAAKKLGIIAHDLSRTELGCLVEVCQALGSLQGIAETIGPLLGKPEELAHIRTCSRQLRQRRELENSIAAIFLPSFMSSNLGGLEALRVEVLSSWWPKAWLKKRALSKLLRPLLVNHNAEAAAISALPDFIGRARRVQEIDCSLLANDTELTAALGRSWQGIYTNPDLLEKVATSVEALQSQLANLSRQDQQRMSIILEKAKSMLTLCVADLGTNGPLGQDLERVAASYQTAHGAIQGLMNALCMLDRPVGDNVPEYLLLLSRWAGAIDSALTADQLRFWAAWRRLRASCQNKGLNVLVEAIERTSQKRNFLEIFESSARQWLLEEGLSRSPPLKNFIGRSHSELIKEFCRLDSDYLNLVSKAAAKRVESRIPREGLDNGIDKEYALLHREFNKRARHRPLRKLFAGMPGLMSKLKPCLLMSPLSVAQHLDAEFPPFELVVFDEASQIPVWDAIGAIARAKQAIVVGDPKQMPPTAFFTRDDSTDDNTPDVTEELESILDETMTTLPVRRLEWHYRSQFESLITFSNRRYYDGRLVTFPSPEAQDRAVRLHRIDGVYDRGRSRTNRKEAEAVVAFVVKHLKNSTIQDESIGVVTFNVQQQELITNLLDNARREDSSLEQYFAKEVNKEEVFVKNLENVQGDERDIIVFSTTFGFDEIGKLSLNFGPINKESGPRRLNVAITRSRLAMHVFSSIPPEHMDTTRTTAVGVRHLKEFLEYAERGIDALRQANTRVRDDPDSPFEEAVASALRRKGWDVHHQIGCGGYRIDLAVVNPEAPGNYLAGIECDGASYHSGATARDRDRLRQSKLEDLGWTLYRIWSMEWWRRPNDEISRIHLALEAQVQAYRSGATRGPYPEGTG